MTQTEHYKKANELLEQHAKAERFHLVCFILSITTLVTLLLISFIEVPTAATVAACIITPLAAILYKRAELDAMDKLRKAHDHLTSWKP